MLEEEGELGGKGDGPMIHRKTEIVVTTFTPKSSSLL